MGDVDSMAGTKLLGEDRVGVFERISLAHESSVLQRVWPVRRNFRVGIRMEHKTVEWRPEISDSNGLAKEDVVVEVCKLIKNPQYAKVFRLPPELAVVIVLIPSPSIGKDPTTTYDIRHSWDVVHLTLDRKAVKARQKAFVVVHYAVRNQLNHALCLFQIQPLRNLSAPLA